MHQCFQTATLFLLGYIAVNRKHIECVIEECYVLLGGKIIPSKAALIPLFFTQSITGEPVNGPSIFDHYEGNTNNT